MANKVERESNSTPLTKKQKSCQYCQEPHKPIEAEDGSFLRIGMSGGNCWVRQYTPAPQSDLIMLRLMNRLQSIIVRCADVGWKQSNDCRHLAHRSCFNMGVG